MTVPRPRTPLDAERAALVVAALPVVRAVVSSVAAHFPQHADREELVQAGVLGMVEAAHRFDPDRGVPFDLWIPRRIRGAVLDALRALDFAPRALRADARALELVRRKLEGELGRNPTTAEIAERAGLTVAQLNTLEGRVHRSTVLSLDVPVDADTDEAVTLGSVLVDDVAAQPLALLERREEVRYVADALRCLPPRTREVVVGYFLDNRTSSELADRLGVTESRVSQLRTEGLELLRLAISAQYGGVVDTAGATGRRAAAVAERLTSAYRTPGAAQLEQTA